MKFLNKLLFFCNILLALSTVLAYISPYINPGQVWFLSVFGSAFPLMVILHFLFFIIWVFVDFKKAWLSVLMMAVGFIHINSFIGFNTQEAKSLNKPISVISYNISNALYAYDPNKDIKAQKQKPFIEFMSRFNDEDILCIQEVGAYATDIIHKALDHPYTHQSEKGAIILSKHKIINKGIIEFGTLTNSCVWADVLIGIDTIRVYSVHLQSNKITKDAENVIDNHNINDEKMWNDVKGIFAKYKKAHLIRSHQAKKVRDHIDQSPHPVLLCGDFNDTPLTYNYRVLSEGMQDVFYETGQGLGTTFNGRIPLLRIDYILSQPKLTPKKFNVVKSDFSDHFPIAAIFELKS